MALCPSGAESWAFSLSDQLKLKTQLLSPGILLWQRGMVRIAEVEAVLQGALVCFPAHLFV